MKNLIKINFPNHFKESPADNNNTSIQLSPKKQIRPDLADLFSELKSEIDRICDTEDNFYCDNIHDRFDGELIGWMESDEIIENFKREYSSSSLMLKPLDSLNADSIIDLLESLDNTEDDIAAYLMRHTTIETAGYRIVSNEIGSILIGETEHQIDVEYYADLKAILDQLSDDDLAEFNKSRSSYSKVDRDSFCICGNPCERAVAVLDPESLLESLADDLKKHLK
jgi:hypothetical protein